MTPRAVIAFGILIATAATYLLAHFVNVLTSALALAGFYFYVFVYTRWLKRTSPQNIVIGGAAGAFPPLVGWAAVTGRIDLASIFLFLIVFYWTPPHFWALALNKQADYGRAGVPMAPLVWGERETIDQMLWYSVLLVALTVLPACIGTFGLVYLVSALVLGGLLLRGVWRVRAARAEQRQARHHESERSSALHHRGSFPPRRRSPQLGDSDALPTTVGSSHVPSRKASSDDCALGRAVRTP
jgi:protoheme IX farnesyltransferase